jgi:tetratricopeptide (TPR) repeat protein
MRRAKPSLVVAALVALAPLIPLVAQEKVPKRPKLPVGADTNHAGTYYSHGLRVLETRPDEAANAFYWAMRIDPTWAQPFYARRLALLMANPRFLVQYLTSRNRKFYQSKEVRSIDSLELRALMLNPYVIRDLDRAFVVAFWTAWYEQQLQRRGYRPGEIPRHEITLAIERELQGESSPRFRAWLAASERRFPEALEYYRKALGQDKDDAADIHRRRGHVFFLIGNDDSARVEMSLALAELRKQDTEEFVRLYDSKAVLEHSIGMIHERRRDFAAAREAYGRALQEDLAYYPAHVRLGLLALAAADTATALSEFALAVEIRADEPSVRYTYGSVLAHIGKVEEAAEQLRKAIELEPFYAAPYYLLGRVAEAAGEPADAVTHYEAFVARAPGNDGSLAHARARVSALSAVAGKP